jgi:hypothetical protein
VVDVLPKSLEQASTGFQRRVCVVEDLIDHPKDLPAQY